MKRIGSRESNIATFRPFEKRLSYSEVWYINHTPKSRSTASSDLFKLIYELICFEICYLQPGVGTISNLTSVSSENCPKFRFKDWDL